MADQPAPAPTAETPAAAAPAASSGGLTAWLPLIITAVTMPALAYVTTAFVLMPKLEKAVAHVTPAAAPATGEHATGHGEEHAAAPAPKHAAKPKEKNKEGAAEEITLTPAMKEKGVKITATGKTSVPLNKILVNVSGTMGSRYLLTSVTLSSGHPEFADLILSNEAQLLDLAATVLASKSIADLEKPSARQVVRTELLTVFNNTLGSKVVEDIFFTEFAIQ